MRMKPCRSKVLNVQAKCISTVFVVMCKANALNFLVMIFLVQSVQNKTCNTPSDTKMVMMIKNSDKQVLKSTMSLWQCH